jgi:hypothetical protein
LQTFDFAEFIALNVVQSGLKWRPLWFGAVATKDWSCVKMIIIEGDEKIAVSIL